MPFHRPFGPPAEIIGTKKKKLLAASVSKRGHKKDTTNKQAALHCHSRGGHVLSRAGGHRLSPPQALHSNLGRQKA